MATVLLERCIQSHVPIAEMKLKYHSNQLKDAQSIVEIAIQNIEDINIRVNQT